MKYLLIIITVLTMISCTQGVEVGEVRYYCYECPRQLDPFELDTNTYERVIVLDVKDYYIKYEIKDSIASCPIDVFNDNTYDESMNRIGHCKIGRTFLLILFLITSIAFINVWVDI